MSCRSKLATLNEKLTTLERRVEYIEARVSIKNGLILFVYCFNSLHQYNMTLVLDILCPISQGHRIEV